MPSLQVAYIALGIAIVLETIATSSLQKSEQFTKLGPTLLMIVCFIGSFYSLSWALGRIPIGIAYAIWSGCGIVLISSIGYFIFKQKLDLAAMIGIGLILAGVVVVNAFSKAGH